MENTEITPEMRKFFMERTNMHINLVKKYVGRIVDANPMFDALLEIVKLHDLSKFENPEIIPYIYITWRHKCNNEGKKYKVPAGIDDTEATKHHVKNNPHHPEYWSDETNVINTVDRDAPLKLIDATKMPILAICEMVADWSAMSEERGTNTPMEWAKKNIGVRWKFTDEQIELIYRLMDEIWGKK